MGPLEGTAALVRTTSLTPESRYTKRGRRALARPQGVAHASHGKSRTIAGSGFRQPPTMAGGQRPPSPYQPAATRRRS